MKWFFSLSFGTVNITVVDGDKPMGGRIIDFVFLRLIVVVWSHSSPIITIPISDA